jgi:hypothetical protein
MPSFHCPIERATGAAVPARGAHLIRNDQLLTPKMGRRRPVTRTAGLIGREIPWCGSCWCSAGFPVIDKVPQLTFCEAERGVADPDDVMLGEHGLGNSLAVYEGAIVTAKVNDLIASRG